MGLLKALPIEATIKTRRDCLLYICEMFSSCLIVRKVLSLSELAIHKVVDVRLGNWHVDRLRKYFTDALNSCKGEQ